MGAKTIAFGFAVLMLCAGLGFAGSVPEKQLELERYAQKEWHLTDLSVWAAASDVNEVEPNNTCPGEAYALQDTYHAAISPGGDEDWITFTCNAGDEMTFGTDVDGALPTVDTVIELYQNDCTTQLTSDDDGGPGLFSLIDQFPAPYTGTYHLKIRGFSGSSTGNYVFVGNCTPPPPLSCPIDGYVGREAVVNLPIPDANPTGIMTPPITFTGRRGIIEDVVIDLEMSHTWVGDLNVDLVYTSSGGATTTVALLARPGEPATAFGCPGDLVSGDKYFFSVNGAVGPPLGEDDCDPTVAFGCYSVAPESLNGLDAFVGLPAGDGSWRLTVSDNQGADLGTLVSWSVHLLGIVPEGVPAASHTGLLVLAGVLGALGIFASARRRELKRHLGSFF